MGIVYEETSSPNVRGMETGKWPAMAAASICRLGAWHSRARMAKAATVLCLVAACGASSMLSRLGFEPFSRRKPQRRLGHRWSHRDTATVSAPAAFASQLNVPSAVGHPSTASSTLSSLGLNS
jgi:hypothetical protein